MDELTEEERKMLEDIHAAYDRAVEELGKAQEVLTLLVGVLTKHGYGLNVANIQFHTSTIICIKDELLEMKGEY